MQSYDKAVLVGQLKLLTKTMSMQATVRLSLALLPSSATTNVVDEGEREHAAAASLETRLCIWRDVGLR
jgi:hypothetical protein